MAALDLNSPKCHSNKLTYRVTDHHNAQDYLDRFVILVG